MRDFYSHRSYQIVREFVLEKNLIGKDDKVIAAVSGGADSVFMLYCLFGLRKEIDFTLTICHFNHLLRKEALEEEQFVKSLSEKLGLEFFLEKGNVEKFAKENGISIEMSAREMRHNFFNNLIKEGKGDLIAIAHNFSDSVETFFLNIERGTGLRGLKGLSEKKDIIIRPILCLDKDEIRDTLKKFKIEFKIDKSNLDNRFKRNKIRKILIRDLKSVYGERYKTGFNSLFENIENSLNAQRFFVQKVLEGNAYFDKHGARVKKAFLKDMPEHVFYEIMLFVFELVIGSTYKVTKRLLSELHQFVKQSRSSQKALFPDGSVYAVNIRDFFYIVKEGFSKGTSIQMNSTGEYPLPFGYSFVAERCDHFLKSEKKDFFIADNSLFQSSISIARVDFERDYMFLKGKKICDLNRFMKKNRLSKFERSTAYVIKRGNEVLFIPYVAVSDSLNIEAANGDLIKVYRKDCLG